MPSLNPDIFPFSVHGLASSIGGPPENISEFSFKTPFGFKDFTQNYRGPILPRPQTQLGGPNTILGMARTASRNSLGIFDRLCEKLLGCNC